MVYFQFYGPRIGAIYHKKGSFSTPPLFLGGGQEYNRRSGTENTPMVIGLGEAAHLVTKYANLATEDLKSKSDKLTNLLKEKCGPSAIQVNFESSPKLPNTLSISFLEVPSSEMLEKCCDLIEFSKSAACHSGSGTSNVLIKSGISREIANCTVRISVGRYTTLDEIEKAAEILSNAYNELKR